MNKLESLKSGCGEASSDFADWMADEEQREELHDLLAYLYDHPIVISLAERWAKETQE